MQATDELAISAADTKLLLKHYATAAPVMERLFAGIPFVWTTLPKGPGGPAVYHGPLSPHTKPKAPVVDVPLHAGMARYPKLSAERILGLVAHGAVEIYSWSPQPADPTRAAFARILIEAPGTMPEDDLIAAIGSVQGVLGNDFDVGGPLVFDGGSGAAFWIPFADGPTYEDVRALLRVICERAVERFPDRLTLEPNVKGGTKAHLHFTSNAVGRFSILPYSARNAAGYPIALPAPLYYPDSWPQCRTCLAGQLDEWFSSAAGTAGNEREHFSAALTAEGADEQRFSDCVKWAASNAPRAPWPMPARKSHGPIIVAAIEVLQDGRSHSAEEILEIALQRHLLDAAMTHKYVYTSLIEYIARANGNGRKPAIVQNADRTFRMNEPPDEWPALDEPAPAPPPAEISALLDRLTQTAEGPPAEFEQAVCDAFEALGCAVTHLGGQKAPDGWGEAPLGPLAYRFTLECKSADEGVNDPDVFEAAKYRDSYGAQYCALVARAFSGEISLAKELENHRVSAWTVDDLQTLLRASAGPLDLVALFAPGFASDALDDLLWERHHGRAKRVRIVADALLRTGWTTQTAYRGEPAEAPRITEDVAMVLVNQDLAAQDSDARCSREDVRAAIDYLASPLVGAITRTDDGSIVIRSP